jgi:MSHA pilin protein MshC
VATGAVTLTIAATNPAAACGGALTGIDGNAAWARDAAAPATAVAPAGVLYFQPSGRVTTSLAGSTASNRSITIAGETPITLTAETGHVE